MFLLTLLPLPSTECKKCPDGTESNSNYDGCQKCFPGSFSNENTNESCQFCDYGYISKEGAVECTKCPAGQTTVNNFDNRITEAENKAQQVLDAVEALGDISTINSRLDRIEEVLEQLIDFGEYDIQL